jgi:hypothetical protein
MNATAHGVAVISLAYGVGLTAVFGWVIRRAEGLASARQRRDSSAIVLNGAAACLGAVMCAAAVVIGLLAMTHE